jgi:hypothetical protein
MSIPTRLECPHCHRHGTTWKKVQPGAKIRCPSCRKPFAYEPQSQVGPAKQVDQESSPPELPPRVGMGGLSVFSQTELVQPASEATVARALAESRRSGKRISLLVMGVMGASALLGLCLLLMFAPRKEPGTRETRVTHKAPLDSNGKTPSTPGKKAWEDAIEEALIPGITPMSEGLGTETWKTGQVLPAKVRPKTPDDAGWTILEVYQTDYGSKQMVYVRLHKKESLDVLRMITKAVLLRASPRYEITYVNFYTPWALGELKRVPKEPLELEKVKDWAYGRFDLKPKPELYVTIQGVTVENEAILTAVPFPPGAKVIGSWIDEERRGRLTIYRDSNDRLYLEELYSDGTKRGDDHELIELPSSDGRRFEIKGSDDDEVNYFLIEEAGDLQTRFKDGMVWKARAIR